MVKKKPVTAEEFMATLRGDQVYMDKIHAQATTAAEIEGVERGVMSALASRGYPAASLKELQDKFAPFPTHLANDLVEMLSRVSNTNVLEAIVRTLGAARCEFDTSPLAELFDETDVPSLRWAIANTISETRPTELASWLLSRAQDHRLGQAREMLPLAVARTLPPDIANPVLVRLLGEIPGHAALGLAESGGPGELAALKQAYHRAQGWDREQIGRTIAIIERRAQEAG